MEPTRDELAARLGAPEPPLRLGEALVRAGLLGRNDLETALRDCTRTGAILGEHLLASGLVRRLDVFRTLSDQWGVPFVDLQQIPPDVALVRSLGIEAETLAGLAWTPVGAARDVLLVATAERPGEDLVDRIRAATGWEGTVVLHATTEWDLRTAVLRAFGGDLVRSASTGLAERAPEESASRVLVPRQVWVLIALAVAFVGVLLAGRGATVAVVLAVVNVVFAGNVFFKVGTSLLGLARIDRRSVTGAPSAPVTPEDELPTYTVLVPAFGEAEVIAELVGNMAALDYPKDRLEVLLLLEEVDRPTIDAAIGAGLPPFVRILVVPDSQPRTKPKACNVGLNFAHGEFLVIFDAEDRPEVDQLRKAVDAFRAAGPTVVCLQGRLNYHNATENLLTRFFTLEYTHWFDLMLEGLTGLRFPIPLGGTSNHFRTQSLRDLGAWDPHNVTEDADLGLRAAAHGLQVRTLASTTYEEACCQVKPWIRQRTRWIKGYMQTALVHTRHPWRFARAAGPRGTQTLVLLVAGTPLAFLAAPVLWAFLALSLIRGDNPLDPRDIWQEIAVANLVLGNAMIVLCVALAALRRRRFDLAVVAVLMPLYWVLHSIAAWRALGQLITRPSYWEKTPHGISKHAKAPSPLPAQALARAVADGLADAA